MVLGVRGVFGMGDEMIGKYWVLAAHAVSLLVLHLSS